MSPPSAAVRERITEIVKDYTPYGGRLAYDDYPSALTEIVNALLALFPPPPAPDREVLERILFEHRVMAQGVSLEDALLSWASGVEKRESWCEHITMWNPTATELSVAGVWKKSWVLGNNDNFSLSCKVPDGWDICPVAGCHAERPSE